MAAVDLTITAIVAWRVAAIVAVIAWLRLPEQARLMKPIGYTPAYLCAKCNRRPAVHQTVPGSWCAQCSLETVNTLRSFLSAVARWLPK